MDKSFLSRFNVGVVVFAVTEVEGPDLTVRLTCPQVNQVKTFVKELLPRPLPH